MKLIDIIMKTAMLQQNKLAYRIYRELDIWFQ